MSIFQKIGQFFSPARQHDYRLSVEIEEAGKFLRREASPQYVASVMAAAASKALREIEQDPRLIEKNPQLLAYYRKAYEQAQTLAEAYVEIKAAETETIDQLEHEEDSNFYTNVAETEEREE
jgi:hypothetical protein